MQRLYKLQRLYMLQLGPCLAREFASDHIHSLRVLHPLTPAAITTNPYRLTSTSTSSRDRNAKTSLKFSIFATGCGVPWSLAWTSRERTAVHPVPSLPPNRREFYLWRGEITMGNVASKEELHVVFNIKSASNVTHPTPPFTVYYY